jgi:LPPG:FO 2-phospho-L-lactate transferase
MLVVLSGGTGGAKLIQGISEEVDPSELTIICNTADDFVLHGLHISPDLDTIMYTLAGVADGSKGWGIQDDTFTTLAQLKKLGAETWFQLGDQDLATHIMRTRLLREGLPLSKITARLNTCLGVKATILPMTDDAVETRVKTSQGEISFQEYFVKQRWQPEVKEIFYAGVQSSNPSPGVIEAIERARRIIICPSNPVTSIGPILAVPGIRNAIKTANASVIGVSPIIGDSAISGPAHKLMVAQGHEASALGVAQTYVDLLDSFLIDKADEELCGKIQRSGIKTSATSIRMDSQAEKRRLAREVLALADK